MAQPGKQPAVDGAKPGTKAAETLSQFVARVLDQLSLSAWLPASALVLALLFVFTFADSLDVEPAPTYADALAGTVERIASTSLGGAILFFAAVIVLTMLTQAFAFESIRLLEGYWGSVGVIEWIAKRRCSRYHKLRESLDKRYANLTSDAWNAARREIERLQETAILAGDNGAEVREWSPEMLSFLGAKLETRRTDVEINDPELLIKILGIPWHRYAPPDLLRRMVNIDKHRRDLPQPSRVLPTRLGNVLRAHEDHTGRASVETMVLEIYEKMPASLQRQHDEQRNRLDLYCSMVFVLLFVLALAVVRFWVISPWLSITSAILGAFITWLSYRAAIASARVYGVLLLDIARRFPS